MQWDPYSKLCLGRIADIYQVLILSHVIGESPLDVASLVEFTMHFIYYIVSLPSVLKIIYIYDIKPKSLQ